MTLRSLCALVCLTACATARPQPRAIATPTAPRHRPTAPASAQPNTLALPANSPPVWRCHRALVPSLMTHTEALAMPSLGVSIDLFYAGSLIARERLSPSPTPRWNAEISLRIVSDLFSATVSSPSAPALIAPWQCLDRAIPLLRRCDDLARCTLTAFASATRAVTTEAEVSRDSLIFAARFSPDRAAWLTARDQQRTCTVTELVRDTLRTLTTPPAPDHSACVGLTQSNESLQIVWQNSEHSDHDPSAIAQDAPTRLCAPSVQRPSPDAVLAAHVTLDEPLPHVHTVSLKISHDLQGPCVLSLSGRLDDHLISRHLEARTEGSALQGLLTSSRGPQSVRCVPPEAAHP
ncbi:MAG: hypothetical protein Q8Q09_02180 [Deltaproteobacteria bacterium]|nr:hypothetical protein [Deltaproteobacteria bacterium]